MFKKMIISGFLALLILFSVHTSMAEKELSNALSTQSGKVVGAINLPPGFENPSALWVQEIVVPIVWLALLLIFLRKSILNRALTFEALLFIFSTTMFWQEAYIDWGAYLLFNPKFALMPWGSTLWTAPNKLWSMIPAYGLYFTPIYLLLLRLTSKLQARRLGLGRIGLFIVVMVLFYIWDFLLEGSATLFGWASYIDYFGPALILEKGNYPLMYPVVVVAFQTAIAIWVLSLRGQDDRVRFESWFGVESIQPGWRRELARIGIWVVVMNGLFLIFITGPVVAVRLLFGHASLLVP